MNLYGNIFFNGVLIAAVAHALIGLSLVWDKVLLKRPATPNLLFYVFWLGAISIFGVLLVPFGFKMPPLRFAEIAFAAGGTWLTDSQRVSARSWSSTP